MTDNPVSDAASDDALSAAAAAAAVRCSALRCRPGRRRHPRCVHCVRLPVDKRHDQHESFASVLGAPCEVRPAASVRLLLNPGRPPAVRQPLRRCRSTYIRSRATPEVPWCACVHFSLATRLKVVRRTTNRTLASPAFGSVQLNTLIRRYTIRYEKLF